MEEFLVETEEYKGHKIKLYQDPDPESPREWDNLGKMVCFHRRYDLGDKHDFANADDMVEFINNKDVISLPLYLMDHSGIGMNTGGFRYCDSAGWDWGQVGYIYATKQMIRKEFGVKYVTYATLQKALEILQAEVETYNKYLTGNVMGYVVEDADGNTIDSCWGFYNNPLDEAKTEVDAHIEMENKHYPKVEVFATKTHKFRARIRESIHEPSYEVTVGGEEWQKGKGNGHKEAILGQIDKILNDLETERGRAYHEVPK